MQFQIKPPESGMGPQAFKDPLYRGAETGWLTVFYTPSRRTLWFPSAEPVPDLDLEQNCYLGLGVRRKRPDNGGGRGRTDDTIAIPGLWLDLDYHSPGAHKTRHTLPPTEDAALSLLGAAPYKPSLIVHSGHGLQVYWLFKEIARFDTKDDREAFSRLCRGWQQLFQLAGKHQGWHVDSTGDLARVLRIPGTYNRKTREPRQVTVRETSDFRYDPSDFSDFAEPDSSPAPRISALSNGRIDLYSLRVPPRIKYLIQHGDSIHQYPSRPEALFAVVMALLDAGYDDHHIAHVCLLKTHGISELPREKGGAWLAQELKRARHKASRAAPPASLVPVPEYGDDLLADTIPPPRPIVEGLLHEGMLLFGGKSKRGKSWLMLDLALAVATGGRVWQHFPTREPQPVLYLALEDGRGRIQRRLRAIHPGITTSGKLQLLYDFPLLNDGAIERLRHYIETWHYRLVIIDVLARIEPAAKGHSDKTYYDIYRTFAPLHDLQRRHPFCLAMLTHLRKAEAEDIFDTLHGTVAYQGVQDTLWVLERPTRDALGVLHVREKDSDDQALHVSFVDGHWEFVGHDNEVKLSQGRRAILELFEEKDRPLGIDDILKGLSRPRSRYQTVKKTLQRMVQDEQLVRLERGQYAAARGALQEEMAFP